MKHFILETDFLPGIEHGWGNGYVVIPEGHPMHGVDYNDIPVSVHGGLSFGCRVSDLTHGCWLSALAGASPNDWVVGFDTNHYGDTQVLWPRAAVEAETKSLADQLEAFAKKPRPKE